MRNAGKCQRVYGNEIIMGVTVKTHHATLKVCRKCKYFTPEGCNSYRHFRAEGLALRLANYEVPEES